LVTGFRPVAAGFRQAATRASRCRSTDFVATILIEW
jgi:hypothetical protein